VGCELSTTCPDSRLLGLAVEFANSNSTWLNAFHDAFVRMTNTGCGDGVCRGV